MFKLHPQLEMDTIDIGDLPICKVLLMNESQFPWLVLVPRKADLRELFHLKEQEITQVNEESIAASRFMMHFFNGEKLNVAALGNLVPQLHLHHVVRNKSDAAWPQPVWGNFDSIPYPDSVAGELCNTLKDRMSVELEGFSKC